MADTLIPISSPGGNGGSNQPGLSWPSFPSTDGCVLPGTAIPYPCAWGGVHTAPGGTQAGPGGVSAGPAIIGNPSNPVTGGTGTAAGAAANLVPGWKGIQDIGAWLSSGAHWKGIGLVAGAVALAGVGLVIVLAGNKDVRRTAEAAAL